MKSLESFEVRDSLLVTIEGALLQKMESAGSIAYPHEACGLLVGEGRKNGAHILELHLSANRADNPSEGFEIDVGLQARLQRDLRGTKKRVLGVWHSHPSGDARPSEVDALAARDPDLIWIITGVTAENCGETSVHLAPEASGQAFRKVTINWRA